MTGKDRNGAARPQRLRLPYMKRRTNAAAWTYDHRVGVSVTIIVYLLLAIAFVGGKIMIRNSRPNNMFMVDLQTLEDLAREQQRLEQEVKMRQSMGESYEQVLNRISNENAERAENRLRHSVHLEVPAYRCRRGGTVVVNITVNRNGNVVSASVDKGLSETDECMQQTAVGAARSSRFDINTSAPERQSGTITYVFVAQ